MTEPRIASLPILLANARYRCGPIAGKAPIAAGIHIPLSRRIDDHIIVVEYLSGTER